MEVALELQLAVAVAREANLAQGHALVEKLQAGILAGAAADRNGLFTRMHAGVPVPAGGTEQPQQQDFPAHCPAESGLTGLRNSAATCFLVVGRTSAGVLSAPAASPGT